MVSKTKEYEIGRFAYSAEKMWKSCITRFTLLLLSINWPIVHGTEGNGVILKRRINTAISTSLL